MQQAVLLHFVRLLFAILRDLPRLVLRSYYGAKASAFEAGVFGLRGRGTPPVLPNSGWNLGFVLVDDVVESCASALIL